MDDEDVYIIPHNYTDNGKILGFAEKQSLYTAAAWAVPASAINFGLLPFSVDVKLFILILLIFPPTLLSLVGIGGDTLVDFAKYVCRFYKDSRVYYYEK